MHMIIIFMSVVSLANTVVYVIVPMYNNINNACTMHVLYTKL